MPLRHSSVFPDRRKIFYCKTTLFFFFLITCFCFTFQLFRLQSNKEARLINDPQERPISSRYLTQHGPGYKVILLWTELFGHKSWYFSHLGNNQFKACPETRCVLSANRDRLDESSIVMFHIRDLEGGPRGLPSRRPNPQQLWAFFSLENPMHTFSTDDISMYDGVFNLSITYRRDSDVHYTYGEYDIHDYGDVQEQKSGPKHKLALWFVSNCKSSRMEYVEELQKSFPVDMYGDCGEPDPCSHNNTCIDELTKSYKFYLAFENGRCKDYITEKFWFALRHNMVPVVLGANREDYDAIAPPFSFIFAEDFDSPQSLAAHLNMVSQNEQLYQDYSKWKQYYRVTLDSTIHRSACDICALAHRKPVPQKTYKISKFWGVQENCIAG